MLTEVERELVAPPMSWMGLMMLRQYALREELGAIASLPLKVRDVLPDPAAVELLGSITRTLAESHALLGYSYCQHAQMTVSHCYGLCAELSDGWAGLSAESSLTLLGMGLLAQHVGRLGPDALQGRAGAWLANVTLADGPVEPRQRRLAGFFAGALGAERAARSLLGLPMERVLEPEMGDGDPARLLAFLFDARARRFERNEMQPAWESYLRQVPKERLTDPDVWLVLTAMARLYYVMAQRRGVDEVVYRLSADMRRVVVG